MGIISPKFGSDSDIIPKGTYLFTILESTVENTAGKDGKPVRRKYGVKTQITGGENEGRIHYENFYSDTTDDFSFARMFGLLIKVGIIPPDVKEVNAEYFKTEDFEQRFRIGLKGRRFGARIGWGYDKADKAKEDPKAEMKAFYSESEYYQLMGKQPVAATPTPIPGPIPPAAPVAPPAPPAPPKPKAPWE